MSPTVTDDTAVITLPPEEIGDPEALIREARARQRRRQLRLAATLLALSVAASIVAVIGGGRGGAKAIERVPNGPTVNLRSLSHHGMLAFISHSKLWLLDGNKSSLVQLPSPPGFRPQQPTFSPDGKWLAYLEQHTTASSLTSHLWLARADGRDAHPVAVFQTYTLIGWRPAAGGSRGDLLAVAAGGRRPSNNCPCGTPTTLRLVSADGSSRVVARASWIYGAAWSPDGASIATAEIDQRLSRLVVQPLRGGPPKVWLSRRADQRLNGMNGTLFDIAGWWRGLGIGFWVFGNGAIHNNDESNLELIPSPGAPPSVLAPTLSDGTTVEFAGNGHGLVAVVADVSRGRGGGRVFWDKKQVQLCGARGRCRSLVPRQSKVTVDPAWSPDGQRLALIEAPDYNTSGWPLRVLHRWYAQHRLLLYDTSTKKLRSVPAAGGATVPIWSRDGKSLLYEAHNALWLLPLGSSKPVRIVRPLFPSGLWPSYYGQIDWAQQFAWSSQ